MKKLILVILSIILLAACGSEKSGKTNDKAKDSVVTLKVGGTSPLIDIFTEVQGDLEKQGVKLEIKEFNDYVTPNIALNEGDIDVNLFQHLPYLESFNKTKGTDLVSAGNVLIAPIGIYSDKYKKLGELPEKATIGIPNDAVNQGRCLLILQEAGLIKVDPKAGLKADISDITENKQNLKFKPLEAAMLPRAKADLDAVFINGNYAIQAKLNPAKDAIYRENANSPYVNILAVKKGRENEESIQKLVKAIQTEKVRKFINEKFEGSFVPAF